MNSDAILREANAAPPKVGLEEHREAISILREKGYTWREIADFLAKRGIKADHTNVYRLITNTRRMPVIIPSADAYKGALLKIEDRISSPQRAMLKAHYEHTNRSITYTELTAAAGFEGHEYANRWYGQLGRDLGETLNFDFVPVQSRNGANFYSSSIGMPNAYGGEEFELVMHHELAKAIGQLAWFQD
jgi:hypothetical protein